MLARLAYVLGLIVIMIAMPLNSRAFSNSTTMNRCRATLALADNEEADNATEMLSTKFMMKRFKLPSCVEEVQPAVRLSAFPNSGTTWVQYLLEEATKVATQSPLDITTKNGGNVLQPGEPLTCRAECGAQIYLHPNCTAGSTDANDVTLSDGTTPEIFKEHYPDFTLRSALFETDNTIQKTILLVRNPLDAYLGKIRHVDVQDKTKVAESFFDSNISGGFNISEKCSPGYTPMRNQTKGGGVDPLGICFEAPIHPESFEDFLPLWCHFFTFWLTHSSAGCTEVTVVRYEDLATATSDVLETIVREAGLSNWSGPESINRSVAAYPSDPVRLSNDVYFNKTFYTNKTIQHWATIAAEGCANRAEDFGYLSFLKVVSGKNGTLESGTMPTAFPGILFMSAAFLALCQFVF